MPPTPANSHELPPLADQYVIVPVQAVAGQSAQATATLQEHRVYQSGLMTEYQAIAYGALEMGVSSLAALLRGAGDDSQRLMIEAERPPADSYQLEHYMLPGSSGFDQAGTRPLSLTMKFWTRPLPSADVVVTIRWAVFSIFLKHVLSEAVVSEAAKRLS